MKKHRLYIVPLFFIPWITTLLDPTLGFFSTVLFVWVHYKTKHAILDNLNVPDTLKALSSSQQTYNIPRQNSLQPPLQLSEATATNISEGNNALQYTPL